MSFILLLLIVIPLMGALLCFSTPKHSEKNAFHIAVFVNLMLMLLNILLNYLFDYSNPNYQFIKNYNWMPSCDIGFDLGVDALSLMMINLVNFLSFITIISTNNYIKQRGKEYIIYLLILQSFMLGSFLATDLFLFYVFFEAVLIPMLFIIGIWGGENRIYASFKFFLYTLFGSVLMLIAVVKIHSEIQSSSMIELSSFSIAPDLQKLLFIAFFASFAIKVPMFLVHTWLPDAHVQAPAGGSMILAGVLLKMGGYGFLRICVPNLTYACEYFAPFIMILSMIAILYASLIALAQKDIKKIIAYSSIAHMGIVTIGIFNLSTVSVMGAIFQMISHGVVSAALFLCIGILYDRFHTREIDNYSGLMSIFPFFSVLFALFSFSSIGLPFTSGFVGEIMVILSSFPDNKIVISVSCLAMVIGAGYMLNLLKSLFFNELSNKLGIDSNKTTEEWKNILQLRPNEKYSLIIMALVVIVLGIFPNIVLKQIEPNIKKLMFNVNKEDILNKSKININYYN